MAHFDSPVQKFPGYIELPIFWNISQLRAFEKTLPKSRSNGKVSEDENAIIWRGVTIEERLPALVSCGIEWHIEGMPSMPTLETFPVTPVKEAGDLIDWAYELLISFWRGEITVPNA